MKNRVKLLFDDKERKQKLQERQEALKAIAEKKEKKQLALEDIDIKLDIIIEILREVKGVRN